jgi:hypothetical protein
MFAWLVVAKVPTVALAVIHHIALCTVFLRVHWLSNSGTSFDSFRMMSTRV